ncbi:Chitin synthase, class 3 [Saitoella coloradoensis]
MNPMNRSVSDLEMMSGTAGASTSLARSGSGINRKKSLVRPERNRVDPDHPNYQYRQHVLATNATVMPSATGEVPRGPMTEFGESEFDAESTSDGMAAALGKGRAAPVNGCNVAGTMKVKSGTKYFRRDNETEASLWAVYCSLVTCWIPGTVLRWCGIPGKQQQMAWREKIGLISCILMIAAIVGYLTFGFTATVCGSPRPTYRINEVNTGMLIIHGRAYDLSQSTHPAFEGNPTGANVLFNPVNAGGQDASFLFQNVNHKCKGLITKVSGSSIPEDSDGNLGWYMPCRLRNQDGSTAANFTYEYYNGYSCHTSTNARDAYYNLDVGGDVYFSWDDVKNSSRNLMVYSGDVIDLDLISWLPADNVTYPSVFDDLKNGTLNDRYRGVDVTHAFLKTGQKHIGECLSDIAKVGMVDSITVGCMASKVVLYVSLVFILAVVAVKFVLALIFGWFLSRRLGNNMANMTKEQLEARRLEIEEWSDDIYRPAPDANLPNVIATGAAAVNNGRRASFLPTSSRFGNRASSIARPATSGTASNKKQPITMAIQQQNQRLTMNNQSRASLLDPSFLQSTTSFGTGGSAFDVDAAPGPAGFVHEAVVPQPPVEYQPFNFPLAHTICLVTAYSESAEGIRSTCDSLATTDYPNSHKLLLIICDGLIKGSGNDMTTPDICLAMMKDFAVQPEEVEAHSYVAIANGEKRHNMAKVYAGFYDYDDSTVDSSKQQRVPMILVVKCGTPAEATAGKPGNRGKRDSQVVLMSFLQKVMFDERMTELEYEMFNGIWKVTGISPDLYEIVLMVDADTKVFPDSLTHMVSTMVRDPEVMGLCGETKIANKTQSWVTAIQVFEYYISHHLSKSFEAVFGMVTCLPGCFCMYRIKAPKGPAGYWVPILNNPDIVAHYSENVVETLHQKNLLLLGEDRFLSTLMLKTFPKRKMMFVPAAVCKTVVPDEFKVLLSQRRRWINSTVHNLMELVLVKDLCGTFCFSMQFVVFIELVGTLVLPAALAFTLYVVIIAIVAKPVPIIPLVLLALVLGLPAVLIVLTAKRASYILWMLIYLISLPVWNLVLPSWAFWHFDDFSWGETRKVIGEVKGEDHGGKEGEFNSDMIVMKRWGDFERDRRKLMSPGSAPSPQGGNGYLSPVSESGLGNSKQYESFQQMDLGLGESGSSEDYATAK